MSEIDLNLGSGAERSELGQKRSVFSIVGALRRRKRTVVALVLAIVASATTAILLYPPYFEASAVVLIDQHRQSFGELQALVGNQIDVAAVRTQVEVLQSPALMLRVTRALDLVHEPEFVRQLDAPPGVTSRVKRWLMRRVDPFWTAPPPLTPPEREQAVSELLTRRVTITNNGRSYLVEVRVRAATAELSSRLANGLARGYIAFGRDMKVNAIVEGNARLDEQLAPLKRKVADAEAAVEDFRQRNGLILDRNGADGATVAGAQLAQLNVQLVQLSAERAQKEATLAQIQEALRTGRLQSVPDVVASPLIQRLREQEADVLQRRAGLDASAMAQYPSLRALTASLSALRGQAAVEIGKIASSQSAAVAAARAQEESLRQSLARLQGEVAAQSEADVQLRQLQSQADAARDVYNEYLKRYEQTGNQDLIQQPDAELVSAATGPLVPAGPPRMQLVGLAVFVAFLVATLVVLLLDRMREGFHGRDEFEAQTGLPVLGLIPILAAGREAPHARDRSPDVTFRGAVNNVRGTLQHGDPQHRAHVVLVTSALPGEGKTFLAASLARSVARVGSRCLVIDCDRRRPAVLATLGVDDAAVAQGRSISPAGSLAVLHDVQPRLDVGSLPMSGVRPDALSAHQSLVGEIEKLRRHYALIVLDAPPVMACAEAELLSGVADGAILVVRWAKTPRAAVRSALATLRLYGLRALGGVITQVDLRRLDLEDGGDGYMYRKYAAYYR
jgi:uncharacterized protein involved in exopolysaccharide biosynthesis/Mrp family chromosome partitioning ATPase